MNRFLFLIAISLFLSACATPASIGTGIKYTEAINPEPEKSALVYVYRKDGWGYGGRAKDLLVVNVKYDDATKNAVAVFQDGMYRPYLFQPRIMTFSTPTAIDQDMDIKAGGIYCIEMGWHFRGIDMITINEQPIVKCKENLLGLELVKALNDVRHENGAGPLQLVGFKELIVSPPPASTSVQTPVK